MAAVLKEATPKKRAPSLGSQIDGIWKARETKRALETQIKGIEADIALREEALMASLDKEGVDASRGATASVSITKTVSASIEDWDAVCAFIKKSGNWQLLQRRVSDPAARELFETKGQVPGLAAYTRRRLNIRSIT